MLVKKGFSLFPQIVYCFLLLFIGLSVFNKTFHLSLMGDEWQMIWVVKGSLATTGHWDSGIKVFHWEGYQIGALLMHLLTNFFGYDGSAVYIFSFVTRYFVAVALFYFLIRRNHSNKIAFFGALLFMLSPIGLQTTDWAKNFTSYISITFFLLCIDSIYNLRSLRNILIFLVTFSLSIYVNTIRAHGIIITVVSLLIFQILFNKSVNKRNVQLLLISSVGIIFLFSRMMLFGDTNKFQAVFIPRLSLLSTQILNGNLQRIEDLFVLAGKGLLPEPSIIYMSLLVVILLFWKRYLFYKKYLPFTLVVHFILFFFFFKFLPISKDIGTEILGIYFTLFVATTFLIELFNKRITEAINTIIPLLLNISFIIIPWIFGNTDITESTHRYLIYSALSVPIIIAYTLNRNNLGKLKRILATPFKLSSLIFYTTIVFLLMFFFSIRSEINNLYMRHNQNTTQVIWQQITPFFNSFDFNHRRPIILIEAENEGILHDSVLFGIDYKLGFKYKIWEENKLPIPLDVPDTLKSFLTDGKAAKRYTGKEIVFPKEDAFYFRIEGMKVIRIPL